MGALDNVFGAGGGSTPVDADAIAAGVYRRLAGGSAVGILAIAASGDPLDVVHSRDFSYTFDAAVAVGSVLVFSVRRDVADATPALEITGSALAIAGSAAANPTDGSIVRLSATQCRVTIKARSLAELAPGPYVAEARELTAAGTQTIGVLEVPLVVRRSASRRLAE